MGGRMTEKQIMSNSSGEAHEWTPRCPGEGCTVATATEWVTKDSGQRVDYPSGMRRDIQDGKPRFALIFPEGVPYEEQLLTRFAGLLARGAEKYGDNNWQLANSKEE